MSSYAVTGAARGIGLEFVKQLSKDPANIVFALVRDKNAAKHVFDLKRSNVHILQADISNVKELKAAAHDVSKVTGGKLDVLINNGAFLDMTHTPLAFEDYSEEDAQKIEASFIKSFQVNVVGVVHTINVFLPLVKAGKTKKIIAISSGAGDLDGTLLMGMDFATPYSVSKAALNLAVGKYAVKYKEEGILFLSISPGMVNTTATAVAPPPANLLKEMTTMIGKIQTIYPDFKGPISTEESVRMVLDVTNKATIKDTGAFVSHKGNKEWI